MKVVADASVAIKWQVEQPHTKDAMQLAASHASLIAPELLLVEAGNTFWKYDRRSKSAGRFVGIARPV